MPAPTDDDREHVALAYDVERLNLALINALGLDPVDTHGFRLDVIPGQVPNLIVFHTPPADALPGWAKPFAAALDGVSYAVLPGQDATMPPVRDPGPVDVPAGSPVFLEAALVRLLPMLAEALNGCQLDDDTRSELSAAADACHELARKRVSAHLFGEHAGPTYGDPDA